MANSKLFIADEPMGSCAGCSLALDVGDWIAIRQGVPVHAKTCTPKPSGSSPLLFADEPRQLTNVAKETLGATAIRFAGPDYIPKHDQVRLTKKLLMVFELMRRDQKFRTINEIYDELDHQVAHTTISANLRHLKKEEFGSHTMNKRRRGDDSSGIYEYQIIPNRQAIKAA